MDLEAEVGRLFGRPPEEFVTERDALARRLREAGDRAGAERVKGLRRPNIAAWAVNQVARRQPTLVGELLEAGERLRQAQRRALSGLRSSGLPAATSERRRAVDRLLRAAAEVLEGAGRPFEPHRDAISGTFQAASVDAEAAEAVRAGTLVRELVPPTGLGEVSGLSLVPPADEPEAEGVAAGGPGGAEGAGAAGGPAGTKAGARAARPTAADRARARAEVARRRRLAEARKRLEDLRRRAERSAEAVRAARAAADEAEGAAADARDRAARLAREAEQALRDAERAGRRAERARGALDEAERRARTAHDALDDAERGLAALEASD